MRPKILIVDDSVTTAAHGGTLTGLQKGSRYGLTWDVVD
jgi:hypothetical protein